MSLREKNGKWEFRFRLNGVRVTQVTDLEATDANRPKAERLELKRRDAILKGDTPVRRQTPRSFRLAATEFLESLNAKRKEKPSTIRRVETSMWSLREWFADKPVAAIRPSDVERYSHWRLGTHQVQPITLRHDLDNLSKFFEWCIRMDLRTDNPVKRVEKPSAEGAIRMHVLTPAEEFDYFHRIDEAGEADLADVARLMLDQGMRPDEVLSLERKAVDIQRGRVTVLQGKTKAARRTLRLTPTSQIIVERRLAAHDGRWLFPSPRREGEHLAKLNTQHNAACAAGEDREELRFVMYDLRHTFATRAAQNGMDVVTLAAILGHSSLRLVMRYVHPQQDHMDREMEKLSQAPPRPRANADEAPQSVTNGSVSELPKPGLSGWKN